MKKLVLLLSIVTACNSGANEKQATNTDTVNLPTTSSNQKRIDKGVDTTSKTPEKIVIPESNLKTYSNQRFKDVSVKKMPDQKFKISGKGQIFEASFGWILEDGHKEIKSGYEMTDAGAPEWGNFSFIVEVPKKRANTTLHLVLFETSAKDGSRQFQLPIPLVD